mgnify:CR=1 FL=1
MPQKSKSADVWASQFAAALANPVTDKIPPGWFTAEQWRMKLGLSHGRTRAILHEGVKCGLIEVRKFRVQTNGYKGWPTMHYRRK